ncbi:hypothetical protein ACPBEH_02720 [Latilactobacillus sp. 5-91]|uniref:hypothetical protein n=1 Tax=Latilactobacillus sp. 5-91 TaxID=3410924 RepID=UPI003C796D4A
MNKDQIIIKLTDLIGEGKLDEAKDFMNQHKNELDSYYSLAEKLIKHHSDKA